MNERVSLNGVAGQENAVFDRETKRNVSRETFREATAPSS